MNIRCLLQFLLVIKVDHDGLIHLHIILLGQLMQILFNIYVIDEQIMLEIFDIVVCILLE